jgi:hypothetical protein
MVIPLGSSTGTFSHALPGVVEPLGHLRGPGQALRVVVGMNAGDDSLVGGVRQSEAGLWLNVQDLVVRPFARESPVAGTLALSHASVGVLKLRDRDGRDFGADLLAANLQCPLEDGVVNVLLDAKNREWIGYRGCWAMDCSGRGPPLSPAASLLLAPGGLLDRKSVV